MHDIGQQHKPRRPSPKKSSNGQSPNLGSLSSRQVELSGTEELHLTEREISSFLHPALSELRASMKAQNLRRCRADLAGSALRAIVGYLGSIEMPPSASDSDLSSLRGCVRRLRLEKKVHTTVLLCVLPGRVLLVSHHGAKVAEYPASELALCGTCADDRRFFGLVTCRREEGQTESNSRSCHVFMTEAVTDPKERERRARAFQFEGEGSVAENEFPSKADPIIKVIVEVIGGSAQQSPTDESPPHHSPGSQGGCSTGSDSGYKDENMASTNPRRLDQLEEEEEMSIGGGSRQSSCRLSSMETSPAKSKQGDVYVMLTSSS